VQKVLPSNIDSKKSVTGSSTEMSDRLKGAKMVQKPSGPSNELESIDHINEALKREEQEAASKQVRNRNRSKKKKGKKGEKDTEIAAQPPQPPAQASVEAKGDTDDEMPEMVPLKNNKGARVFRKARKVKGKSSVCTLFENLEEGTLHFNAYAPGSSIVVKVDVDDQKLASLVSEELRAGRFEGSSPGSKQSSPKFCLTLVEAIVREVERKAGFTEVPALPKRKEEPKDAQAFQDEENAEEAEKHKNLGNDRFRAKDASGAFAHFESAVMLFPRHLVYHLNCAAALLEMKEYERAVKTCKNLVSACRSWQYRVRIAEKHSGTTDPEAPAKVAVELAKVSGGNDLSELLARAYARIGSAYRRQGKIPRATNAFLLSLKETESKEVRKQLTECYTMASQPPPGPPGQQPPGQPGLIPGQVPDMEDFLANNQVIGYKEKFKFECTGCGECCRTSDHIMLTPYDLFRLTRAENMATVGIRTTWALRQHNLFKEALKYTLRNGLPVCFLRPAKNTKQGHCHFAYPLHKYASDDSRKDKVGKLLTFEEVHSQELVSYEPVRPDEYNLTEEEENATYAQQGEEEEEEEEEEEDSAEEADEKEGGGEEEQSQEVEEPDPEPQLNSYGKQALACMLGVANMPTMCATYPMAREVSWADFWHEHGTMEEAKLEAPSYNTLVGGRVATGKDGVQLEGEGEEGGGVAIHMSRETNTKRKHKERLAQSKYVMVRAEQCEGFYPDGKKRTDAFPGGAGETKEAGETTIEEFLHGESHIAERYDHNDWFLGLIQRIVDHGTEARMASLVGGSTAAAGKPVVDGMAQIRRRFMETLAKVWYNFDALRAAKTRPFKSWARLQKSIEDVSWSIVHASDKYVRELEDLHEAARAKGVEPRTEKDNADEYTALLTRLRI
jgi:tetratricopeptide (TPR) repeat protein